MNKLLVMIFILAFLASSCGQSVPNNQTAQDDNSLLSLFSEVPSDPAGGNLLYFSNMERIKELAGVAQDTDISGFVNDTIAREVNDLRMNLLAGWVPSNFSGEKYLDRWRDEFGFDAFNTFQEIQGASLTPQGSVQLIFSIMRGNFTSRDVIFKLNNLGYQRKSYNSVDYYSIRQDNEIGNLKIPASQLAMAFLNRIMVNEKEIVAAPADNTLFKILDARSSQATTLNSSLAYTRIAGSLGDVLGAALIPPAQLRSDKTDKGWNSLHNYDLAGIGYRWEDQKPEILIVLHYPDGSASEDIPEISRRMAGYRVTAGNPKTPLLSDLFDIKTPEAVAFEKDSLLKIILTCKPAARKTLWYALVGSQDLGFLVPD